MNNNTIVALYDTIEQARQAVQALKQAGYTDTDISLVANDTTGEYARDLTSRTRQMAPGKAQRQARLSAVSVGCW